MALVLTRLGTTAMSLFLAELSPGGGPNCAWRGADGQGRLAYPPAISASPKTSAWCSCRPARPSSTRSSGCGCICATIVCRTASFAPPRRSSTVAVRRGIGCSAKPDASARCAPIPGSYGLALNQVGISPTRPHRDLDLLSAGPAGRRILVRRAVTRPAGAAGGHKMETSKNRVFGLVRGEHWTGGQ